MFISRPSNEKPITDAKKHPHTPAHTQTHTPSSPLPSNPKYTDTHAHDNEKQAFLESVTSFINRPYAWSHAILRSGTDAAINLFC